MRDDPDHLHAAALLARLLGVERRWELKYLHHYLWARTHHYLFDGDRDVLVRHLSTALASRGRLQPRDIEGQITFARIRFPSIKPPIDVVK